MAARRPAPPKEETTDETPPDTGGEGGDGATGDGAGDGDRPGDAHLRQIVREVVADVLGGGGGDGGDGEPEGEGRGGRLIDEERAIEQRVKRELERVAAASELERVKEEVKKIVEKPPVKHRRSTRFMGWVGEDDR